MAREMARSALGVGLIHGDVTAAAIVAELGDARRFKSSDDAVRYAGLEQAPRV